ncbi:anion transporter [Ancylomarina euxinus]|uniref:Anion transporter n=1 Tax=Ancylomarina euxinus TaxID=2283627 RepID=A0A425XX98_9BACT|nr:DASS family sodium-coupled anion symporter [Ancylomarina euxinus]MCZ4696154.1 DASS family sodium-coupled anion symporter [Ancylomarina euxinus]MUP16563.1 DASS family sodium-coupled anion symporter [Ancylomarina euxinus]RRG19268.1 anion transporter [Ancylomarina euxinus]
MTGISKGWKPDDKIHHKRGRKISIDYIIKVVFNLLGPVLFGLSMIYSPFEFMDARTHQVVALVIWMLVWWITEFVPLPVTSLLPLIILPTFSILDMKSVAIPYSSSVIFLFLGGFIIALALEKWTLHRRIALYILKLMGSRADSIVLGFVIASAFLSMWISNTATAVMMLPIILSVVAMISKNSNENPKNIRNLKISMLLGMAYGANIGGMGTLIGTPPNAILAGYIRTTYNVEVGFLEWMLFALPIVIALIFIMYILITKVVYPNRMGRIESFSAMVDRELEEMGKMGRDEKSTFALFILAALMWITRSGINSLFNINLGDTSIAMFISVLFFLVPTSKGTGERLLEWKDTSKLPWGVLILFGGGLSIASALGDTGILSFFANYITSIQGVSVTVISLILMLILVVMTELMSNTALATIFLPIIASIGISYGMNPVAFAAPMILAMSCVFSLPMGTPPNAVIFASGELKISNMVRVGFMLDPISVSIISLAGFFLANLFLV